jgi:hypothetical protein
MIFGPKDDGTYVVEFRTAAGEALAISIPRGEAAVIRHFQECMPYGLFVPDVREELLARYSFFLFDDSVTAVTDSLSLRP